MGAADKLKTIAENLPKVYEAGVEEGFNEGEQAGIQAEYDRFWDAFQDCGKRTNYRTAFSYNWNDEIFQPKYDIVLNQKLNGYNSQQAFEYCKVQDMAACLNRSNVTIDTSQAEILNSIFRGAETVSLPPLDLSNCLQMPMTFYSMPNLKSLEIRNLREDCVFDRAVSFCYALENLSITGTIGTGTGGNSSINLQHSPLTKESLLNVIDCLKDFREIIVAEKAVESFEELLPSYTLVDGDKYTLIVTSDNGGTETSSGTVGDIQIPDDPNEVKKGVIFEYTELEEGEVPLAWIYQEGEKLMFGKYLGSRINPKITLLKSPTETHSITLGNTNLAKLTNAEKAKATQRGWTLL